MKYSDILSNLTREEKVSLCSQRDFWTLAGIPRAKIPSRSLAGGVGGLIKPMADKEKRKMGKTVPATCFPSASTLASSWDDELIAAAARAISEEALAEKVGLLLAPDLNIKRSPLCGRNAELFSEDPYLTARLGQSFIDALQGAGVGACLQNFAADNSETRKMTTDNIIDERTLHELYLYPFKKAVENSRPYAVMTAPGSLNSAPCEDSSYLKNTLLRESWGFDGAVLSSSAPLKAEALTDEELDAAAEKILELIEKTQTASEKEYEFDAEAHHNLALRAANESAVLLKNEGNILPINPKGHYLLIGEFMMYPRFQPTARYMVNPSKLSSVLDEFVARKIKVDCVQGYYKAFDRPLENLIKEACEKAEEHETVIVLAGLPEQAEAQGMDRKSLKLPENQNELIRRVAAVNPNTIVIVSGGSAVEMDWVDDVKAVLYTGLSGQGCGESLLDLLTGKANPCGKLSETFPLKSEDLPTPPIDENEGDSILYAESIFCGYKYYDKAKKAVLFEFGFGLSYSKFEYSDFALEKAEISEGESLKVTFKIKNKGKRAGAEIAQLYISHPESNIFKAKKQLCGFKKVFLNSGDSQRLEIEIPPDAFSYFNTGLGENHTESGEYKILLGASSRDIKFEGSVYVTSARPDAFIPDYKEKAPSYYSGDIQNISACEFKALYGKEIKINARKKPGELDLNSTLYDARKSVWGQRINKAVMLAAGSINGVLNKNQILHIPIGKLISTSDGAFTQEMAESLLLLLNGKANRLWLGRVVKQLAKAIVRSIQA